MIGFARIRGAALYSTAGAQISTFRPAGILALLLLACSITGCEKEIAKVGVETYEKQSEKAAETVVRHAGDKAAVSGAFPATKVEADAAANGVSAARRRVATASLGEQTQQLLDAAVTDAQDAAEQTVRQEARMRGKEPENELIAECKKKAREEALKLVLCNGLPGFSRLETCKDYVGKEPGQERPEMGK